MNIKMHRILAEHTVSMTELRKNPAQYFTDEPIAVLSNNRPFIAKFRPSAEQLKAIALHGQELIEHATDEDLNEFSE